MIRLMWIVTVVWICAVCGDLISGAVMDALPAGNQWAKVAGAVIVWSFMCWWLAVIGAPALVLGWVIAILVAVTKANRPLPMKREGIPLPDHRFWERDRSGRLVIRN